MTRLILTEAQWTDLLKEMRAERAAALAESDRRRAAMLDQLLQKLHGLRERMGA